MRSLRKKFVAGGGILLALLLVVPTSVAATAPDLGAAEDFAILAGSGITNTGTTTVKGDVGSYPTSTQTGFSGTHTVVLTGTNHHGDGVTQDAKNDTVLAYNSLAGAGPTNPIVANLAGQNLTPGVYNSASSIGLSGLLILDGSGNANSVFIFQAGSTLTTGPGAEVRLTNGTQACNVFWQIGSSATLDTGTDFSGTIIAMDSISLLTGTTVDGRVLARNAAVTMQSNTIQNNGCAASPTTSIPGPSSPTTTSEVPFFPSATALALGTVGALGGALLILRRRN